MTQPISIRRATAADCEIVATIHIASRRVAYSGLLSPEYLNGPIEIDTRATWTKRLGAEPGLFVLIADQAHTAVGFLAMACNHDPEFGNLIDNFHVLPGYTGTGIGRRLFDAITVVSRRESVGQPMYLWVYEDNHAARQVYRSLGGIEGMTTSRRTAEGAFVPAVRVTWPAPEGFNKNDKTV